MALKVKVEWGTDRSRYAINKFFIPGIFRTFAAEIIK